MKIDEKILSGLDELIRSQKDAGHSKGKVHLNILEAMVKRIRDLETPARLFGPVPGRRRDKVEVREDVLS